MANGSTSKGKHVTRLPFEQMSEETTEADTFEEFETSLMSVGKTADDGNVSVFTERDVKVYKETDVLITCKGKPILIGRRDERGRYRIPLMQQKGIWQPRKPTKAARKFLHQANSVYDLPSTEEVVKWMHATGRYPVKSTWIKEIKAGNFTGWPIINERTVAKYYPETKETPKGHLNQTRKISDQPSHTRSGGGAKQPQMQWRPEQKQGLPTASGTPPDQVRQQGRQTWFLRNQTQRS